MTNSIIQGLNSFIPILIFSITLQAPLHGSESKNPDLHEFEIFPTPYQYNGQTLYIGYEFRELKNKVIDQNEINLSIISRAVFYTGEPQKISKILLFIKTNLAQCHRRLSFGGSNYEDGLIFGNYSGLL